MQGGKTCMEIPKAACDVLGNALKTYATPGKCTAGKCEYPFTSSPCGNFKECKSGGSACTACDWNMVGLNTTNVHSSPSVKTYLNAGGMVVDKGINAHLCYDMRTVSSPVHELYYANNVKGSWVKTKIPGAQYAGNCAIALDKFGQPHISYHYANSNPSWVHDLRYAHLDKGTWKVATLDNAIGEGKASAIVVDSKDTVHVAYYNKTGDSLYYLTRPAGGAWATRTLVDAGAGRFPAMVLDHKDQLHISHASTKYVRYSHNTLGTWSSASVAQISYADFRNTDIDVSSISAVHVVFAQCSGSSPCKTTHVTGKTGSSGWSATTLTAPAGQYMKGDKALIALDSKDRPHVLFGSGLASWGGSATIATNASGIWRSVKSSVDAAGAMAMDHKDVIHMTSGRVDYSSFWEKCN